MADTKPFDPIDELDAFFSAAASSDPNAIQQAAQNITDAAPPEPAKKNTTAVRAADPSAAVPEPFQGRKNTAIVSTKSLLDAATPEPATEAEQSGAPENLAGKFIAIDPADLPQAGAEDAPFVLIPADIHSFMPWWGWLTIALGMVVLVIGILVVPILSLNRLAARLGDGNQANVQSAMRQLVINSDERTIGRLYDMALSRETRMPARLRAVDTLGLMQTSDADRALLRLELSHDTDAKIREAAIAARKQRAAAKSRNIDQ